MNRKRPQIQKQTEATNYRKVVRLLQQLEQLGYEVVAVPGAGLFIRPKAA